MHVWWQRMLSLFTVGVLVLFSLAVLSHVTCYWLQPEAEPTVKISLNYLDHFSNKEMFFSAQFPNDNARGVFDLDTDLRPLFNWNTKMLFLQLVASFETENNDVNEVVVWDRIILKKDREQALLHLRNERFNYPIVDDGHGLRSTEVVLSLKWMTTPITGLLWLGTEAGQSEDFRFPPDYQRLRQPMNHLKNKRVDPRYQSKKFKEQQRRRHSAEAEAEPEPGVPPQAHFPAHSKPHHDRRPHAQDQPAPAHDPMPQPQQRGGRAPVPEDVEYFPGA